jgi:Asp-tRNA(Asn)/Glu-tRNA(Gln) amidotransferase A subunit family amidase
MRRILRKIAENDFSNLGDTSTLADPAVVDDLVKNRAGTETSEPDHPATRRPTLRPAAPPRASSPKQALARIADPKGEGAAPSSRCGATKRLAAADASDVQRKAGLVSSPLGGIPVSIKNLCNVAGETTLAGSKALDDTPPAKADAPVVARLRAAGAVIVGSTNMSEFAFSGVGF